VSTVRAAVHVEKVVGAVQLAVNVNQRSFPPVAQVKAGVADVVAPVLLNTADVPSAIAVAVAHSSRATAGATMPRSNEPDAAL
jgi:hypothetical protein